MCVWGGGLLAPRVVLEVCCNNNTPHPKIYTNTTAKRATWQSMHIGITHKITRADKRTLCWFSDIERP